MGIDKLHERRSARIRKNLLDFLVYGIFLFIVIAAGHLARDSVFFQNGRTLEDILRVNNLTDDPSQPLFLRILEDADFYTYMKEVFIPVINSGDNSSLEERILHSDDSEESGPTLNSEIVLLGVPRIRQVRIQKKNGVCPLEEFSESWYSTNEDLNSYSEGWTPDVANPKNLTEEETYWRFQSADQTLSTTRHGELANYDGSGYIAELERTIDGSQAVLKKLNDTNWIDECTKAIFVELSLYNPNINIHSVIVLLLEKSLSLHYIPKAEIHTWRFAVQDSVSNNDLVISDPILYVWITIFVLCLLYFLVFTVIHALKSFHVVGYNMFKRFLLWVDILIITLGTASIWNHFSVSASFDAKVADYSAAQADKFVNFQIEQESAERQIHLFVLLTVLAVFRLWYLLVISSRFFFIIGFTFSITGPFMVGCIMIFFVLLIGFSITARIHFGELFRYRTFRHSILTLIYHAGLRNVMSYDAFVDVSPIFGRVFFMGFTIFVVFLFINVMASVLTMGLQEAKETALERQFRFSYSEYLLSAFIRRMPESFQKKFEEIRKYELPPEREEQIRNYFTPILSNHINSLPVKRVEIMKQIAIKIVDKASVSIVDKKVTELVRKNRIQKITEGRVAMMEHLTIRLIQRKLKLGSENELQPQPFAALESQCQTLENNVEELMALVEQFSFWSQNTSQVSRSNVQTPTSSKEQAIQRKHDSVTYLNEGPGSSKKK